MPSSHGRQCSASAPAEACKCILQAAYFRANMRVLAAGGDGTVAWILGTIAELGLDPPPHVAVHYP